MFNSITIFYLSKLNVIEDFPSAYIKEYFKYPFFSLHFFYTGLITTS